MREKILFAAALLSLTLFGNSAHGQSYYTYIVPQLRFINDINLEDGVVAEQAAWGLGNAVPLCRFDERDNRRNWKDWPQSGENPNDVIAVWQAAWLNDRIYFSVVINDDLRDEDNLLNDSPPEANLEEDDAIQIFRSKRNMPRPSAWSWPDVTGSNALRHANQTRGTDKIYLQTADNLVFMPQVVSSLVFFTHSVLSLAPAPFQWSAESFFKDTSGSYAFDDSVWSEIIYHDADNTLENGRVVNDMRMTWNTQGKATDDPLRDPWNWPGKLVIGRNVKAKEYLVYESSSPIITDGTLNESAYAQAMCVAQVSARNANLQAQNARQSALHKRDAAEAATQVAALDTLWRYWTDFNDAFIIWRAVTDLANQKLHLAFIVLDDVSNVNDNVPGDKVIEDDGLLLMVDVNKNEARDASDFDFNILRNGKIYKYSGFGENYDTLYTGQEVVAKVGDFGPARNWQAEVEVKFPQVFKAGETLRIELGYNDADADSMREHQLMWSTIDSGKTPWSDFSNLGRFILTGKKPPTSVAAPRETAPTQFALSPSYPNPFAAGTTIAFGLPKREHVTINVYDLAGRLVATLVDRPLVAGAHAVQWNGTDAAQRRVANGVYFVRMTAGALTQTQKMVFIRGR